MVALTVLAALVILGAITLGNSLRIVKQYERGVVFRLGRVNSDPKEPGMKAIVPFIDRLEKVNLQIVTMPVPAQEGITRDNVTVRVDAVIYFKVVDPRKAIVDVEDYRLAVGQVAQTSLRSIIGQSELDDLMTNRERLNQGRAIMIDNPAVDWGGHIDRVEIKDVALPETLKRSMSRPADAERGRRCQATMAATALSATPPASQLRPLPAVVEAAAEKNSPLVLPFPVELLRFLEGNTPTGVAGATTAEGAAGSADEATTEGAEADATTRADLDAIVKAMSESLRLTGTMPEQERSTSDMPDSE